MWIKIKFSKHNALGYYIFQAWISSDFDDDFETHFNDADFAKPLPPSSVPKSANKRKINNNLNGKIKSNVDP